MRQDRERWDKRYLDEPDRFSDPDEFLVQSLPRLKQGRALDLACGLGGNALLLARNNFDVLAVDISLPALQALQSQAAAENIRMDCVCADLDYFPLPRSLFDLVIVFYFFERSLARPIVESLKPGGFLVYSTFNHRHVGLKPDFKPEYLAPAEGLASVFPDLETIVEDNAVGVGANVSRLLARKPGA